MARQRKNYFLTSQEIYDQWLKWKKTGNVSNEMASQMYKVADHLLYHPRFVRYPQDIKDDMRQEGVLKIIRNLKNMREEYKDSFFNYYTRCCWTANIVILSRYYKEINLKRQMIVDTLERVKDDVPGKGSSNLVKHLTSLLDRYDSEREQTDID